MCAVSVENRSPYTTRPSPTEVSWQHSTMLSLDLLAVSNGKKMLCWEPQHCLHSEEPKVSVETPLMFCPLYVFCALVSQLIEKATYLWKGKCVVMGHTGVHTWPWCSVLWPASWSWVLQPSLQTEEMRYLHPDPQISGQLKCLPGNWFQTSALPNLEHGLEHRIWANALSRSLGQSHVYSLDQWTSDPSQQENTTSSEQETSTFK